MMFRVFIVALPLAFTGFAADNLKSIANEPNLVKRARLALANAEHASVKVGEACKTNDYDACNAMLTEVQESVELADKALDESGIDPGRSPRHFKDAEIRTRKIMRQVEAIRAYIRGEDLPHFDAVYHRISEIDDRLLTGIMSKKKK